MKIFLDTIGCRLNTAEMETLARQFRAAGHQIVPTPEQADLAVVNTCAVTTQAASDSRSAIRRAARQGAGKVVVTGCWGTLEPENAVNLPGVFRLILNQEKDMLAAGILNMPLTVFDLEPLAREPLPGAHHRTRAFIKAQDGCDNACTFCVSRLARGPSRSRSLQDITRDVQAALAGGTVEIVLTGVHLGSWGKDLLPVSQLSRLAAGLLEKTAVPRLRLSSLEPWDLEAEFFALWRDPRLCRHLHLPLQSGSPSVLKRMGRKTSPEQFADLVRAARTAIPEVAITTDLIAGFPGETELEFNETLDFVRRTGFSAGHVFHFSPRPGTVAALMKDRVRGETARQRSRLLRQALADSAKTYHANFIGKQLQVLWESVSPATGAGWQLEGLTDNYIRVTAFSSQPRWNHLDQVLLLSADENGCRGELLP